MTLVKFKPSRELLMDSMIPSHVSDLFNGIFNDSLSRFERNVHFTPRIDVLEKNDKFELLVSLPGLKKDEVNVEVEHDTLVISGERKFNNDNKDEKYHSVESFYGRFKRSFTLPENVNTSNIKAEMNDGILKIELLKSDEKVNKTIVKIK